MTIAYFYILFASIVHFIYCIQPSQIKIISRGELYVDNSQTTPTVYIDNISAFKMSDFPIPLSNFKVTFTGWIQTGVSKTINKYQSKIQIYNSADIKQKLLFFGNNSTHFILKQDLTSSTSSCICELQHKFNTDYRFIISLQQDSSGLQMSLTLGLSDGTLLTCKNSETIPAKIFNIIGKTLYLTTQIQRPADTNYIYSTQKMGSISMIQNYYFSRNVGLTNLNEERFLLGFNPIGLQLFFFKFSYEQKDCNCLVDSSENQIQAKFQSQFGVIENLGGGGYFIYSFTQSQALNFAKSNIRFGQPMDNFYNSLNINQQSNSNAFESILLSFWAQINGSVQTFQILQYTSIIDQLYIKLQKNSGNSNYQLNLSYQSVEKTLISTLSSNQFYHFVDLYIDGDFISRTSINLSTLFSSETTSGDFVIGGANTPITSIVGLSQIRMFSSSSILSSSSLTDTLITNCMTIVQERGKYTCLLCKSGYFLDDSGQCLSSCNSSIRNQLSNVRYCSNKCSYKCRTCAQNDPFRCLTCDIGRMLKGRSCYCVNGTFEDYKSNSCYAQKKMSKGYEIGQFTFKSKKSMTVKFKNEFNSVPLVVFSVLGFSVDNNTLEPFEVTTTSVSEQQMVVASGVNLDSNGKPNFYLHVQYFAYESTNKQFFSSKVSQNALLNGPITIKIPSYGSYKPTDNFNIHVFLGGYLCNPLILNLLSPSTCFIELEAKQDVDSIYFSTNVGVLPKQPLFYYLLTPAEMTSYSTSTVYDASSVIQNNKYQEKYHPFKMSLFPLNTLNTGLNPLALDTFYAITNFKMNQDSFQSFKIQPNEFQVSSTGQVEQNWEIMYNTESVQNVNVQTTILFDIFINDNICGVKDYYTLNCVQCIKYGFDPNSACSVCLSTFIKDSNGDCVCPAGKFFDSTTNSCQSCNQSCSECIDGDTCTVCKGSLVSQQSGLCGCSQPRKWFDSNGACFNCLPTCDTCSNGTQCTSCKLNLTLNPSTQQCDCPQGYWFNVSTDTIEKCYLTCDTCSTFNVCTTCKGGRIIDSGLCVCISNDARIFEDDLRCSQSTYAVLDPILSINFLSLKIDFGISITPVNSYTDPLSPQYSICQSLFNQQTLNLLGNDAKCIVKDQSVEVMLDSNGRIMPGDTLTFNQNILKYNYNNQVITTYYRNKVIQSLQPPQSEVMLKYALTQNYCYKNTISIDQIINDGKRGIKYLEWNLSSILPEDGKVIQNIQAAIQQANLNQSRYLDIFTPMASSDLKMQIKLKWNLWINQNGEETINILVEKKKNLRIGHRLTTATPFYVYKDIELIHSISCEICDEVGRIFRLDEPLTVYIKNSELGIEDKYISFTNKEIKTQVKAFSMISQTLYKINAVFTVESDTSITKVDDVELYISPSELTIKILGGSRYASYKSQFSVSGYFRDFEMQNPNQNISNDIQKIWKCINIATNQNCVDIKERPLDLKQGIEKQTFEKYTFSPYSVVQIEVQGQKERKVGNQVFTRTGSDKVIIFITEMDIPPLEVVLQEFLIIDPTINPNQIIHAEMIYDPTVNIDQLFYSGAILYENEVVGVIKFDYKKIRFQVWNYFDGYTPNNVDIQVRFSVYNPQYVLPSLSTITFKLNFPPKNCSLKVSPNDGYSLVKPYEIEIIGCEDENMPLKYQFFYYVLQNDFNFEIKNPLLIQRKQFNDLNEENKITTHLPNGKVLILAQAIDSRGAISNSTLTMDIKIKSYTPIEYVKFINTFISTIQSFTPELYILNLDLLVEDLLSRESQLVSVQDTILQKKLYIINELQFASKQIMSSSTFYELATQCISSLLYSKMQMQSIDQQAQIQLVNNFLDQIEKSCITSEVSQQRYEKCIGDIYLSFNWLDSLSTISKASNPILNKQFISITERMGNILNEYAYPNENLFYFQGKNIQVKTQKITEKNLFQFTGLADKLQKNRRFLEQTSNNIDSNTSNSTNSEQTKIYDASYKIYDQNFYQNEDSFVQYTNLILNQTQKSAETFPVINPSIVDSQTKESYEPVHGIIHYFNYDNTQSNLTCFGQQNKKWTKNICSTRKNEKTQEIQCVCPDLTPTTIINDISDLFENNQNLDVAFSESGIENISNFSKFYLYLVFWVLVVQTMLFIFLSAYGMKLDSKFLYESIPLDIRLKRTINHVKRKRESILKVHPQFSSNNVLSTMIQNNNLNTTTKTDTITGKSPDQDDKNNTFVITEEEEIKGQEESPMKIKKSNPITKINKKQFETELQIAEKDQNQIPSLSNIKDCSENPERKDSKDKIRRRKTIANMDRSSFLIIKDFNKRPSLALDPTKNTLTDLMFSSLPKDSSDSENNLFHPKLPISKLPSILKLNFKEFELPECYSSQPTQKNSQHQTISTFADNISTNTETQVDRHLTEKVNEDQTLKHQLTQENRMEDPLHIENLEDDNINEDQIKIENNVEDNSSDKDSPKKQRRESQEPLRQDRQRLTKEKDDSKNQNQRKQFVRGKKQLNTFRYVSSLSEEQQNKLTDMNKVQYYVYFHEFISTFLVFKYDISRAVRFIMFYLRYLHTIAMSILFGVDKTVVQSIFLSIASSLTILIVSLVIENLLTSKNFLSKVGGFLCFSLAGFYMYCIFAIVSGQQPDESNLFIWPYFQFLITDLVIVQTFVALIFGFFAKRFVSKPRTEDEFFSKLFNLLKLNVIISTLLK